MDNSVEDLMNNDYFKQLRLDMLNGVKNKNCSDCYNLEERTGHSYRQDFNQNYDEHFDKVLETNEDGSLDCDYQYDIIYAPSSIDDDITDEQGQIFERQLGETIIELISEAAENANRDNNSGESTTK